jgi:multiple sugar transport system permease protein
VASIAQNTVPSRGPFKAIWKSLTKTKRRRDALEGYLFTMPVILGLLIFTLGPMLASFYFSFTQFDILSSPEWTGLTNYIKMFTKEEHFWQACQVTALYAVTSVPLGILGSFLLALLLNQKVNGIAFFRTCFYIPTVVPAVASAILWGWLLNPDYGLINAVLSQLHLPTSRFLGEPETALPSLVLMSLWGIGGGMVIYLAGLQGIPESLYEAAKIDGANEWDLFLNITIPMMTPTIFFNLVMGLIGAFQTFIQAFIMTSGGPMYSTYFYNLMLYERAFRFMQMGMASAMAWFLCFVILVLTLLVFRSSSSWVYYETAEETK